MTRRFLLTLFGIAPVSRFRVPKVPLPMNHSFLTWGALTAREAIAKYGNLAVLGHD